MEVLSDILRGIRASGSVYFCDLLSPPWELAYQDENRAMFHLLRSGLCRLEIAGETLDLETGDFVFIAPQVDHRVISHTAETSPSLLLCGYCRFDQRENDVFLRALPDYVLMRRSELNQWPWLKRTLEHLSAEYLSQAPGSELTVNKLTEILLVQLLRADFGHDSGVGLVAALNDKRLARVLAAIHENPGQQWTIASAAKVASMSRSGFARRFKNLLEVSFFDYLTRLRMRNARELLSTSTLRVQKIAERVGYQSDLSFVKAFKRMHGETPRVYRDRV